MKHVLYILFIPLLFTSCKKQIYHSFTDEERAFLVYDKGETFKLKNETTGDTIEFTVTERNVRHVEDFGPKLGPSRKEHFMEEGRIEFERINTPSNTGYIYIYKDKIDQFILHVSLTIGVNSFGDSGGGDFIITNTNANGISYKNVYGFTREDGVINCYLSKEYGFVKLEHPDESIIYTRVP